VETIVNGWRTEVEHNNGLVGGPPLPDVSASAARGRVEIAMTPKDAPQAIKTGAVDNGWQVQWRQAPGRSVEAEPGQWRKATAWTDVGPTIHNIDNRTFAFTVWDRSNSALRLTEPPHVIEVRVRIRNDRGDNTHGTNYFGLWRTIKVHNAAHNEYAVTPSPPTNPSASVKSDCGALENEDCPGELNVSWSEPAVDGGANVHYYTVRHKVSTAADTTYVSQIVSAAAGNSTVLEGLTGGTQYTVQIRAHNIIGHSGWTTSTATPAS